MTMIRSTPDAQQSAASIPLIDPPRPRRPVRTTYRRLRMGGLTETEAANLTAHLEGLAIARSGWHVKEIEGLLFIRELARSGRIGS